MTKQEAINMTKQEAIKWFKEITSGTGVDRFQFPDNMKGSTAKKLWNDSTFTYGIEYGVLIALHEIYKFKKEDFK